MIKNKIVINRFKLYMLVVCGILISACSQMAVEKDIAQKVNQESNINTQADLNTESASLIETAPNLTDKQRGELIVLRESFRSETKALTIESLRLRSVLMKELLSADYRQAEVNTLKNKIKKAEDKKLAIMMDSIKKTNLILGRQAKVNLRMQDTDFIMHDFNY